MNLYEIASEYQAAFEELSNMEGITEDIIKDTLSPIAGDFEKKSISLVSFFRNIEAEAKAIKAAQAEMSLRRIRLEEKADKLKEYIKTNMMISDIKKISCPYFSVNLSKGGKSVEITEESKIPKKYMKEKITYTPDKDAIKKDGGCEGVVLKDVWKLTIK